MKPVAWIAVITALAAFLAACDGDEGDRGQPRTPPPAGAAQPGPDPGGVLASVNWSRYPWVRMDLIGLNRLGEQHVVAQVRLTNTADGSPPGISVFSGRLWDYIGGVADQTGGWLTGIGLVDSPARRLLMPYRTADNGCVCSRASVDSGNGWLEYDKPLNYFAVMPAPSGGATTTTVWSVMAPPMGNVPISDDPPVAAPGVELSHPDDQQVTPVEYRIETPSEAVDGSRETIDQGAQVQVHVSSDVLFEVGESDLSPRARAILTDVAAQIDASTGTTVTIEGHADSTGTDAINDPLSQERAEAVHEELTTLVTRTGIQYDVRGYGSHRPLYSNDSEEGRRHNRRVTIGFAKPEPPSPPPPPRPATTGPVASAGPGPAAVASDRAIEGQRFTLEVTGLNTIGDGLGVLAYRVTNTGTQATWDHELIEPANLGPFRILYIDRVSVIDHTRRIAYPPGRIANDGGALECACTPAAGVWGGMNEFEAGQAREFYAIVQLPEGASTVAVKISEFPELTGVPITG